MPVARFEAMSVSFTLALSGGASLGAYEAGVAAALLEAADALGDEDVEVTVDAVGGASAGALVALFAAYAHVNRLDPVWLLREAWVERVSLDLLGGDLRSPLGFEKLRARIRGLLDPRDRQGRPIHRREGADRPEAVGLHVALTGLRGLHYPIDGLGVLNPIRATTYADWGRFALEPDGGPEEVLDPAGSSILDFVLASACNPAAFAPTVLDRSQDAEQYWASGIEDLPEDGHLWYTDGGLLQAEPIGRVLTAARRTREEAGRAPAEREVTLLVDPRSEIPTDDGAFAGSHGPPSWLTGISRSLSILPAQILYDDLRRVQKVNSRLSWAERLVEELAPHLDADATALLAEQLATFRGEDEQLGGPPRGETDPDTRATSPRPGSGARQPASPDAQETDPRAVLEELLGLIAGLERKRHTEVDVISPLLLVDDAAEVAGVLAGSILGDFGGFLDRALRESDFLLGYDSALAWLTSNLSRLDVDERVAERVVATTRDALPERWHENNRGSVELGDLGWRARVDFGRLVARMAAALGRETLSGVEWPRRR
jgi:predicted acylesterase/phospholipase RssA